MPGNTNLLTLLLCSVFLMACGGGGGGNSNALMTPVANKVLSTGNEDAAITLSLTGSDSDGSISSFTLETLPANGTLFLDDQLNTPVTTATAYTATANSLTLYFVPATNYNGETSFDATATDNDSLTSDVATATITVKPVNDAPVLANNSLSINEGQTKLISTSDINATDVDNDNTELTFTINNDTNGQFERVSAAGTRISTFTQADLVADNIQFVHNNSELPPSYTVTLSDGTVTTTAAAANISYSPINDNPPLITSPNSASVAENTTVVLSITATDGDLDTLTYSIAAGGADNALFSINSGVLSFNNAPDFENPLDAGNDNTYLVNVGASDGLTTTTQLVSVTVTNTNDNNPVLTSAASAAVQENTTLVQTVTATDNDNDTLTYSIVAGGADNALFSINNGILSFISAPDFETPLDSGNDNNYEVKVGASDGLTTTSQTVVVSVSNLNDNNPVFSSPTTVPADENATTVYSVSVTDGDNDTLNYSLELGTGGDDNSLFDINSTSGALTFKTAPDFEAPADANIDNAYQILIGASDGTTVTTQAVTINVNNLNDNSPVLTSATKVTIKEGTLNVQSVTATDSDNDTLNYSLEAGTGGEDNLLFDINTSTGVLSFKVAPDFNTPTDSDANNAYQVLVGASDGTNTATQAVTVTVALIGFPFVEDFSTGSDGWVFVNDYSENSNWQVNSGLLKQILDFGISSVTQELDETYHRGTYAYLSAGLSLTDYRVSADLTPFITAGTIYDDGHDKGLMFRYQDNDNYYRIVLNSEYGYSRLDRKVAGVFTTLAVDARGYINEGVLIHIDVEVVGDLIQVYIDGEARFAVKDNNLTSGSIALYTEDGVQFDNIVIDNNSTAPSIVIDEPAAFSAQAGSVFAVSAVVLNKPITGSVEFNIDGSLCSSSTEASPGYFTASCTAATQAEHTITATLKEGVTLASDSNAMVGSSAEVRLVVGDSISNGVADTVRLDNHSIDGKVIGEQGYVGVLQDRLSASRTAPQILYNEAVPGDKSPTLNLRLPSILARHPAATIAQVMIGTNDTGQSTPIPSGLGCSGAACNGTYKENMQAVINTLTAAGITPVISLIPPAFIMDAPLTDSRNLLIQEYNTVLLTELSIAAVGPDFFTYFLSVDENRVSMFADQLHFNGLGYMLMADLWEHYLNGGTTLPSRAQLPLVFEDICIRLTSTTCEAPLLYKQDLMQTGNPYYIDEAYDIQSIPSILDNGVWLKTADADKANTRSDYLTFTIDRNTDLYIAYDAAATALPSWLSGYTDTGQTLTVSNTMAPTMRLYKKSYQVGVDTPADGTIQLGGNLASGAAGADANYIVIIKTQ